MVIKHVALFEGRHYFPLYVRDSIFATRDEGYDPMNIIEFEKLATAKFIKWKADGYDAIYIYLSGLVTATTSVINAAFRVGMYIRLYNFSFIINKWLPQLLAPIEKAYGPHPLTMSECELWKKEDESKARLTRNENTELVSYVRVYYDMLHDYGNENTEEEWSKIESSIYNTYKSVNNHYIQLMKPYLCQVTNFADLRKREYTDVIRDAIEARRHDKREREDYSWGLHPFSYRPYQRTGSNKHQEKRQDRRAGNPIKPVSKGKTFKKYKRKYGHNH